VVSNRRFGLSSTPRPICSSCHVARSRNLITHASPLQNLGTEEVNDASDATTSVQLDVEKLTAKEIEKFKHGGRLFAVIYLGGHQWKVTTEDILVVQGHMHFDVGDRIRLEKVLLVGGENFSLIGRPLLPSNLISIEATVIEKTRSSTFLDYFHIPRKSTNILKFRRYPYNYIRINRIVLSSENFL